MEEQRKKVLVIDDDASKRVLMERFLHWGDYLKTKDCEVITVESGNAGVTIIDQFEPDLVITDLSMGDGNGFVVLDYVHRNHGKIPTIMATSDVSFENAEKAYSLGAKVFMDKDKATGMDENKDALLEPIMKAMLFEPPNHRCLGLRLLFGGGAMLPVDNVVFVDLYAASAREVYDGLIKLDKQLDGKFQYAVVSQPLYRDPSEVFEAFDINKKIIATYAYDPAEHNGVSSAQDLIARLEDVARLDSIRKNTRWNRPATFYMTTPREEKQ